MSTTNHGPFPNAEVIVPALSDTAFSAWVTRTWQLGSLQPSDAAPLLDADPREPAGEWRSTLRLWVLRDVLVRALQIKSTMGKQRKECHLELPHSSVCPAQSALEPTLPLSSPTSPWPPPWTNTKGTREAPHHHPRLMDGRAHAATRPGASASTPASRRRQLRARFRS